MTWQHSLHHIPAITDHTIPAPSWLEPLFISARGNVLLFTTSLPSFCCHTTVIILIQKGGDRSLVTNYRPVSLTSVVCKQMEHVTASYLRQVWDKNNWLYEGQYGFRPGYSCESKVITVCQDTADSLDNGDRIEAL